MDSTKRLIEDSSLTNPGTSSIHLDTLQSHEKSRSQNTSNEHLLLKGLQTSTAENLYFEKEMSELLAKLGLEPKNLSNDLQESLEMVVKILKSEGLTEMDEDVLEISMLKKQFEEKKKEQEQKKLRQQYDKILKEYQKVERRLGVLQDAVTSLENDLEVANSYLETEYPERVLMAMKLNKYNLAVEKLEEELKNFKESGLMPDQLLEKYQLYLESLKEKEELDKALEKWQPLPPNLLEAKVMLEEKEREYKKVEEEFLEKTAM